MPDVTGDVDVTDEGDYEIWRPNGHVNVDILDGEVFENVLIDNTEFDNTLSLRAHSNDWTVRNVGFLGQAAPTKGDGGGFSFMFRCSVGSGSTGLIENIFMEGWGTEMGGIWLSGRHDGTLEVRNSWFAGFGNNSIYASNPGKNGGNGPVIIDSCVSHSSTTGNFRIGTQGSRVLNSVVTINDPECERGGYPGDGSKTPRPICARHYNDQRAENCSVYIAADDCNPGPGAYAAWCGGGSDGDGPVLTVDNCHVETNGAADETALWGCSGGEGEVIVDSLDNNITLDVLQDGGVPVSADMAALGDRVIPDEEIPEIPSDGGGSGLSDIINDGENEITFAR